MPLYVWRAVDQEGVEHHGRFYAFSVDEVQEYLSKKSLGLIQASVAKRSIFTSRQKDAFFAQLASLLSAHIPLYESLCTMKASWASSDHVLLLDSLSRHIAQGATLTEVLEEAQILDPLSRALIGVGESTGTLGPLLKEIVSYRAEMALSVSKIKRALSMPLLTLCFFCVVMLGMFTWIIPQFGRFFELNHMPMPWVTSWLMGLSSYMTLKLVGYGAAAIVAMIGCLRILYATRRGKEMIEIVIEYMPIIGSFHRSFMKARTLKVLGILLAQQVPLTRALEASEALTFHDLYRRELSQLKKAVERGETFTQAWHASYFSDPEIEGLLALGEVSGCVSTLMLHASDSIEKKLYERLHLITMYANPTLLLVLAVLIGCLIYGIYMPLLEFSSVLC